MLARVARDVEAAGIAKAHYGDADRWQELFEANREVIKDPDKIYPGQRIRVPQG